MSIFGLLTTGRSAYEEIARFRKDELFRSAFELDYVPARETLRIYLGRMERKVKALIVTLVACNFLLLKRADITLIDIEGRKYIPVDDDVSTLDSEKLDKEGVGRTYLGTDGYMLGCEPRLECNKARRGRPIFTSATSR